MKASRIPQVFDDRLCLPDGEQQDAVVVGSSAWYSWLLSENTRSFAFKNHLGSFTVQCERKRNGRYWYMYRKKQGKLYKTYLGKAEELSRERLFAATEVLARRQDAHNGERAEESVAGPQEKLSPLPIASGKDEEHLLIPEIPAEAAFEEARKLNKQNLPVQRSPLIGREQESATICTLLQRSEVRLVTLTGTGGIGKTRLGLQVAANLSGSFVDGIHFVPLASIRAADLVMSAIAQALGIKESGGQSHLNLLKTYLHEKRVLLLLDNFEQIIAAAPEISYLLTSCLYLKILLTSRAPLHISGEHEFHVLPLAVPDLRRLPAVERLAEYAAVALFLQRARMIKPDFQVTTMNAAFIAEICVRLDGLPLAIELAAARSKLLPPQALLARLGRRLAVLTTGELDAPARQQTLRNTLNWSYDLLNEDEQRLFRYLSLFVGGCYLSVFEKLCEASGKLNLPVLDGVASLLDKNLLQVITSDEEEPRLTMLETVREYGLECLAASPEMEAIQRVYIDTYCAFVEEADRILLGIERDTWPAWSNREQETWLDWMEKEHGNLRATLEFLLQHTEVESATRFTVGIANLWFFRGSLAEGRHYFERVVEMSRASVSQARGWLLYVAGWQAFYHSDERSAQVWLEESLPIFQSQAYPRGMAANLIVLSDIEHHRGNTLRGDEMLEESLRLYRGLQDYVGIGHALMTQGILVFFRGELARALSLFEESLRASKKVGQRWVTASDLHYLGWTHFLQGDLSKAHQCSEESQKLFKEIGYGNFAVESQVVLADEVAAMGDEGAARVLLEEALLRGRAMESQDDIARALYGLGSLVQRQGDLANAYPFYEEALAILKQKNEIADRMLWVLAACLEGTAGIVFAQGQSIWAVRLLAKADVLRTSDAYRNTIGYDQRRCQRIRSEATAQLGVAIFHALWAEGRAMTTERVLMAQGVDGSSPDKSTSAPEQPSILPPSGLTRREFEVLRLLAEGLTNAQIAERLVISPTTVNSYLSSIYSKLGVSSRLGAMRYVIDHRLS